MTLGRKRIAGGNPEFRRRKENKRQAEESVEFLRDQIPRRAIISCKRKTSADIFMWPKSRKKRVVKDVEKFFL